MRIMSGGSPQVCMLEKIIKDTLSIDAVIEEGDGKPADFIIKTAFTDIDKERQLFALIDRYKLAGKSYRYENQQVDYKGEWSNYVCERVLVPVVSRWSEYVCERRVLNESNQITLALHWRYDDNYKRKVAYKIVMRATSVLTSEIKIDVVFYTADNPSLPIPAALYFKAGAMILEATLQPLYRCDVGTFSPTYDHDYEYSLKTENIYE